LLVLGMLWSSFALEPLELRKQRLLADINLQQASRTEIDTEAVAVVDAARNDPNASLRKELELLATEIGAQEQRIRELAGDLIAPEQMAEILRSVLEKTAGLEFVALEGLGAEPLLADTKASSGDAPPINAYRHGFRVRFSGSYLDTLAYLRTLEALPWRFFWDKVTLDVDAHPRAQVEIVVYTLSLDRRWIGV
jgi:MSHA biogenesis protein MshJ